ncbi:cytochrome P450 [Streptomyces lycii]|uniref:Cytochrome P450 n=1 Tax=Streptomyces lycii TaxID=2654337 RepID=A0ABQ7FIN9_9ACTN|nr:cytochrome P450 [Streptomyces lycii]KAF4408497.1 cytochrome P450 [Streptomyces lycii]
MTTTTVPTAPGAVPLIGHGLQLWRQPLRFVTSLNALGPVVRFFTGPAPSYMVTTPELVHRLLVTDARAFRKGRLSDSAVPQVGTSLLMDIRFPGLGHYDSHRRHRRTLQPGFHPSRIAGQVTAVRAVAERATAARWRDGRVLRVDRELLEMACAASSYAVFGCPERAAAVGAGLVAHLERAMYWRAVAPRWTDRVPGSHGFARSLTRLHSLVASALAEDAAGGGDDCLVSFLGRTRYDDTGEVLSPEQIGREVVVALVTGTHAAGNLLPWVFHELARHPEAEQRLHGELDTVLGHGRRPVEAEDLPRLTYARQVLFEVLRLYPPVWLLARRALEPVRLGDVELPEGAEVAFSKYALHRHPALHRDPDRFDPDRWLPERARSLPRGAYIPFGTGHRKCIGDNQAVTHSLTMLAAIASRWRLRSVPGHRVRPHARIFLDTGPLPMRAEARR